MKKRFLSILMVLCLIVSLLPVHALDFVDRDEVQHLDAVELLAGINILQGDDKGNLNPKNYVTRAEAAKMLYVLCNGGVDDKATEWTRSQRFGDVPDGAWFEGYVNWCFDNNIIAGRGNGIFDPQGEVTGIELAKMMLVIAGYNQKNEYVGAQWSLNTLRDALSVGVFDGLHVREEDPMNRDDAARLIYNGLGVGMVEIEKAADKYIPILDGSSRPITVKGFYIDKVEPAPDPITPVTGTVAAPTIPGHGTVHPGAGSIFPARDAGILVASWVDEKGDSHVTLARQTAQGLVVTSQEVWGIDADGFGQNYSVVENRGIFYRVSPTGDAYSDLKIGDFVSVSTDGQDIVERPNGTVKVGGALLEDGADTVVLVANGNRKLEVGDLANVPTVDGITALEQLVADAKDGISPDEAAMDITYVDNNKDRNGYYELIVLELGRIAQVTRITGDSTDEAGNPVPGTVTLYYILPLDEVSENPVDPDEAEGDTVPDTDVSGGAAEGGETGDNGTEDGSGGGETGDNGTEDGATEGGETGDNGSEDDAGSGETIPGATEGGETGGQTPPTDDTDDVQFDPFKLNGTYDSGGQYVITGDDVAQDDWVRVVTDDFSTSGYHELEKLETIVAKATSVTHATSSSPAKVTIDGTNYYLATSVNPNAIRIGAEYECVIYKEVVVAMKPMEVSGVVTDVETGETAVCRCEGHCSFSAADNDFCEVCKKAENIETVCKGLFWCICITTCDPNCYVCTASLDKEQFCEMRVCTCTENCTSELSNDKCERCCYYDYTYCTPKPATPETTEITGPTNPSEPSDQGGNTAPVDSVVVSGNVTGDEGAESEPDAGAAE